MRRPPRKACNSGNHEIDCRARSVPACGLQRYPHRRRPLPCRRARRGPRNPPTRSRTGDERFGEPGRDASEPFSKGAQMQFLPVSPPGPPGGVAVSEGSEGGAAPDVAQAVHNSSRCRACVSRSASRCFRKYAGPFRGRRLRLVFGGVGNGSNGVRLRQNSCEWHAAFAKSSGPAKNQGDEARAKSDHFFQV
jgi:hypothetical protein